MILKRYIIWLFYFAAAIILFLLYFFSSTAFDRRVTFTYGDIEKTIKLPKQEKSPDGCLIFLPVEDSTITATASYRNPSTSRTWKDINFKDVDGGMAAVLPNQGIGQTLEYTLRFSNGELHSNISTDNPVTLIFMGSTSTFLDFIKYLLVYLIILVSLFAVYYLRRNHIVTTFIIKLEYILLILFAVFLPIFNHKAYKPELIDHFKIWSLQGNYAILLILIWFAGNYFFRKRNQKQIIYLSSAILIFTLFWVRLL
jgi:hypothetical protein